MNCKITKKAALEYHEEGRAGKIEVVPTKPYSSQYDLSLAYSPGVAYPCEEIHYRPEDVYKYTDKGNLVAVISNGTAVLGHGDIGPLAAKPVMEGKALLFKIFAGLDAFDLEIDENDPDKFVETVRSLAPTFGGINLEDIKAPECFTIEKRLREECDIPVMHDDQHGTAIISGAALINAVDIQGKKIEDMKVVVNGAGAAAISCTRLYERLGVRRENIVMCDSKGVIRKDRKGLSEYKAEFATDRDIHTLAEALEGADLFLGLSVADVLTVDMIRSMAPRPIVFALANPDPEISYELAMSSRDDLIMATGRSDYPNQINNVIGFPYIFRGALDCQASTINEEMKIAAVHAIARLARKPVPSIVDEVYDTDSISFGKNYIIPKALDPRLITRVAPAVVEAAVKSGVARKKILDPEAYRRSLQKHIGDGGKLMRGITDMVRKNPKRIVFDHGECENMIKAASRLAQDHVCIPILLGNPDVIDVVASREGISLEDIVMVDNRGLKEDERRKRYARLLFQMMERDGMTLYEAENRIWENDIFAMMMLESGDADGCVCGVYSAANKTAETARSIIGIREGYGHFATMHIMNTRKGTYFLCDTSVNSSTDEDTLTDIVRLADESVRFFNTDPVMALLSYSNFGSNKEDRVPYMSARAVRRIHELYPEIRFDGEMQASYALDRKLRDKVFPFNAIKGENVNTLIFPDVSSANITYRMLLGLGAANIIGPIQIGLRKSIHFIAANSEVGEIVDIATIASLYATVVQH